jgi:uncharacterized membrane protein
MPDFIQEYFVNPILYQDKYAPYNAYNTIVYAIIAIIAVFLLYKAFRKAGITINKEFFKAIIPFVLFGSILRVAEDAHLAPRAVEVAGITLFPFVTPGIYILTFLLFGVSMVASLKLYGPGEKFAKAVRAFGVGLSTAAFVVSLPAIVKLANAVPFLAITGLACLVWYAFKIVWKKRGLKTSFAEESVVFAQALDGSATFVGVGLLGYSEQHIVGNAIFSLFGGPWAFLALKIAFALVVVELVRKEKIGDGEKNYLLLLVMILGLAPGLRDALRILAGV